MSKLLQDVVGELSKLPGVGRRTALRLAIHILRMERESVADLFVLHEGTVVTITDRLDGWCEVVIADGKKGWVEGRKIEII